eukprot:7707118-Alexandrium_andersonii.AAC.1
MCIRDRIKSGNAPELDACQGKRHVTVNEAFSAAQKHVILNPTTIKKLVSLDDPVATTGKYKDPCLWKGQCMLLIASNTSPRFPPDDGGCKSRLAFVNMPFTFVQEPKGTTQRKLDPKVLGLAVCSAAILVDAVDCVPDCVPGCGFARYIRTIRGLIAFDCALLALPIALLITLLIALLITLLIALSLRGTFAQSEGSDCAWLRLIASDRAPIAPWPCDSPQ